MADFNLDNKFRDHTHNGLDSKKLNLKEIRGSLSDLVTPSSTISDPSGGETIDAEARTAINSILDLLQEQGLME